MWPFSRRAEGPIEDREATGGYTGIISQLVELQAAGTTQQASATAAMEAAAGALSRAFMGAAVDAPPDIAEAVTPRVLSQIGRDLVRVGESLHVIRMSGGRLHLFPASTWYWEGAADPRGWTCTATTYGPSDSETWRVPFDSVVFATWGSPTARPYHGLGPGSWARDTARLMSNAERSLADEAGGPVAQMIPIPGDGGAGDEDDPLRELKSDIAKAKGNALLTPTTADGWLEGRAAAPQRDWKPERLGPQPPEAFGKIAQASFNRFLAAAGVPPGLFAEGADGTAMRESLRQWHMGVVRPMAHALESELSEKFGEAVTLKFDGYPMDMVSRAQVFSKLAAVEGVSPAMALALAQIGDGDA